MLLTDSCFIYTLLSNIDRLHYCYLSGSLPEPGRGKRFQESIKQLICHTILRNRGFLIFVEFISEGTYADTENLGRMGAVSIGLMKGMEDHLLLHIP